MEIHFVEATDGIAYGKFLVMRMDHTELHIASAMPEANGARLLTHGGRRRFNELSTMVYDLQRGTGAAWFLSGGASGMKDYQRQHLSGLERLVCPMYFPFVRWLHEQERWAGGDGSLDDIPRYLEILPWGAPDPGSPSDSEKSFLARSEKSA